ncbi:MAG TPA: biotin--[acetyl-CoA-carboxylase] ligase [Candidatus Limnocylindria bacterium]|nr:biotin--[acetyl-CoA-carboxylase] ligase [Candidatus Limnocylindria bacterium]
MLDPWQDAVRPMGRIGRAIEAHERIGSTNDRARALLDAAGADGLIVLAEEQTAGRGRRGRTWLSPPGLNLMVSVCLQPRLPAREAWRLGLASALGVLAACRTHARAGLKWPNDLVADDGRKLAGLLVETMADGDRLTGAVVGIGINVNWPRDMMPAEIAAGATSLADLAGAPIDRVHLLAVLLEALEDEVARIEAGESPLDRYRAACTTLGTAVSVATPTGVVEGLAADLDATGSLVVEAADGRHVLSTGEVVRVERRVPA